MHDFQDQSIMCDLFMREKIYYQFWLSNRDINISYIQSAHLYYMEQHSCYTHKSTV